ncbi:nickel-dependent lactate racemase [Bacteroidota bacterium]
MDIRLAYGKEGLNITIPSSIHLDIVEPAFVEGVPDQNLAVDQALEDPVDHIPLRDTLNPDQKAAIIFSDITRATPYHILVPALLKSLSHLPDEHITFFCATGTHRPAPYEELCTILGKEIVDRFRIVQNDANERDQYTYVGTTQSGNRILLNSEILEYNLRILTGFIEPHFFAGFSGGGKALMPGMAYVETIRYNHSLKMLENETARWGNTYGNPLWEDVMQAAEFAAPLFLLNITLNKNKEITGVFAGDLRAAHKKGTAFARETAMIELTEPYDIVITSNSGYPLDLNVYQSVKGMSAAEQIIKPGGSIIMAAECWDGIPAGSDYETILKSADNIKKLTQFIKDHEAELKDTWQVYFQAMIQSKTEVYFYSSLEKETVERALLKPISNIDSIITELAEKYGPDTRICVLPEGPQTIPYIRSRGS